MTFYNIHTNSSVTKLSTDNVSFRGIPVVATNRSPTIAETHIETTV